MEILGGLVLAIVFTTGLVDLIRVFRFWLLKPLCYPPIVVQLLLENEEECEYQLRAAVERIRWMGAPSTLRVQCLNPGQNPQIQAVIHRFAARYRFIEE